jgi:hypothetical protein
VQLIEGAASRTFSASSASAPDVKDSKVDSPTKRQLRAVDNIMEAQKVLTGMGGRCSRSPGRKAADRVQHRVERTVC